MKETFSMSTSPSYAVIDMLSDDFYSIGFSLTVWGHRL
jgi:hypothetical protein